jgi:hypothetical protein
MELLSSSISELKAIATAEGVKEEGRGWSSCCPPRGAKADIRRAIELARRRGAAPAAARQPTRGRTTNINAIANRSSGRLATALSVGMADAILHEKTVGGEFASFADLQRRVHGVGPTAVRNMESGGFVVRPRGGHLGSSSNGSSRSTDSEEDEEVFAELPDLRGEVASLAPQVWRHRRGVDLYTLQHEADVVRCPGGAEVDHAWECQLFNHANAAAAEGMGVGARTIAAQRALKGLVNSRCNLNVTTHAVNRAKWPPIQQWLRARQRGECGGVELADVAREQGRPSAALVDSGDWARIEQAMVSTWDELERARGDDHRLTQRVLGHLHEIMGQMHLQGC